MHDNPSESQQEVNEVPTTILSLVVDVINHTQYNNHTLLSPCRQYGTERRLVNHHLGRSLSQILPS